MLLGPALPLIGLLVLIVRLNSRGPGIFRQVRVGKRGRTFTMYKLRSMRIDAEAKTGPAWSPTGGDPRVTRLGYWLRRLHLDELPQLFNVVRGEMSLVGPRPERPEFVEVLAEQIPGYLNRLMVQPGITGLAQINLPPDTDLDSVRRKLILDCEYIRSASSWLDFRIVAVHRAAHALDQGPGGHAAAGSGAVRPSACGRLRRDFRRRIQSSARQPTSLAGSGRPSCHSTGRCSRGTSARRAAAGPRCRLSDGQGRRVV